jgi:hypothetical protein
MEKAQSDLFLCGVLCLAVFTLLQCCIVPSLIKKEA